MLLQLLVLQLVLQLQSLKSGTLPFWENLNTSIKIHRIEKLIVINHKDCGAAKIVNGKKEFSPQNEIKIHENSFEKIKSNLKKKHPRLKVELSLMSLNGRIDKF